VLAARLAAAVPGTADARLLEPVTRQMAGAAADSAARVKEMDAVIAAQFAAHPDAHVFASLPRAGTVRAARLLAEIGDCRSRYPSDAALAAAAGVCPVTRQSGKREAHCFRWAVNTALRDAACDFAGDSRHANAWAAGLYDAARSRGKDHPHAVRILARAWIRIIWPCWQQGIPYDPAKHRALQDLLARQAAGDREEA
jgi:transposase